MVNTQIFRVNISYKNTADNESGLLSLTSYFIQSVTEVENRMKLFRSEDENDREVRLFFGSYTLNVCKIAYEARKNFLYRLIGESMKSAVVCPIEKGTRVGVEDAMFTDTFLPPIPIESKFRLENKVYAKLKGQKKFTKIHSCHYYVSIKK